MPVINTLFPYILKINIALLILGAIYWFFLRKETFHRLNRWIMLGILFTSLALPFFMLRQNLISNPLYRWVDQAVLPAEAPDAAAFPGIAPEAWAVPEPSAPAAPAVLPEEPASPAIEEPAPIALFADAPDRNWDLITWAGHLYWLVALMLGLRLLMQVLSVGRVLLNSTWRNAPILFNERVPAPFSFFHWIVLNPEQHSGRLRDQIIAHEAVHAREGHTADILLMELFSIFCWFNPMIWALKKAVRLNLEFIADEAVLRSGQDKKEYQYNLLKSIVPDYQLMLANHFNHSFIKNRIAMMNAKKSPVQSKWKYLFILPAVLGLMLAFSPAVAQHPAPDTLIIISPEPAPAPVAEPAVETPVIAPAPEPATAPVIHASGISTNVQLPVAVGVNEPSGVTAYASGSGISTGVTARVAGSVNSAVAGTGVNGGSAASSSVTASGGVSAGVSHNIAAASPTQEGDIYVVIRRDTKEETLKDIRNILADRGIDFEYSDLKFNEGNLITNISISVKVGNRFQGRLDGHNDGGPIEAPLVVYLRPDTERFGVSKDIPDDLEPKVRQTLEKLSGLWITSGKGQVISGEIYKYAAGGVNKDKAEMTYTAGSPTEKKNIFVVISANTTKENIDKLEKELKEKGLYVHFKKLEFTREGLISKVKIDVTDDHGLSGNISNTYGTPEDQIYLYRFYDSDGGFGIGRGSDLDKDKKLPKSVRNAIKETKSGYKIGTF